MANRRLAETTHHSLLALSVGNLHEAAVHADSLRHELDGDGYERISDAVPWLREALTRPVTAGALIARQHDIAERLCHLLYDLGRAEGPRPYVVDVIEYAAPRAR